MNLSRCRSIARALLIVVLWPSAYDQVQTALAFSLDPLQIGVELKQIRNGFNVGRRTACGLLVQGTKEAMSKEFHDVFQAIRGTLGQKLRKRIIDMRGEVMLDMQSGKSSEAMRQLIEF